MKAKTKVARVGTTVLLGAAVLCLAFLGLGPRTGLYRTLTVLTGSMEPEIGTGSVVVVTPQPAGEIETGQVIVYNAPIEDARVVTHRVVEIVEDGPQPVVRTKGDANAAPDPWTARLEDDTVWVVRGSIPWLGTAIRHLRHPLVRPLTVLGLPAILALVWLAQIWRPGPPEPLADVPETQPGDVHASVG